MSHRHDLHLDRISAARLLRRARAAAKRGQTEPIEWSLAALPEHRQIVRLAVDRLLDEGNFCAADALIAKGLIASPNDPALRLRKAKSHFAQGRARPADCEARMALRGRPHHRTTLLTAADAAGAVGDGARRVLLLQQVVTRWPHRDDLRAKLVEALLDEDWIARAAEMLASMKQPGALLRSRVLAAQGQIREAIALLEEAAQRPLHFGDSSEEMTCALIDLLERSGDEDRLRRMIDPLDADRPRELARSGASWLLLGECRTAAARMAMLRSSAPHQRTALAVQVVASALAGRLRLAELALAKLLKLPGSIKPKVMVDLWRRSLTGRFFRDQLDARAAGADQSTSLLQPLLRRAIERFESEGGNAPDLDEHRLTCLALLGRLDEAVDDLDQRTSYAIDHAPRLAA